MTRNSQIADRARASRAFDALGYEAPFLIEKLVKDRIVDTADEAEALFAEVKRYMVLASLDEAKVWHMYSLRIDECWHQFILFTRQYIEFSQRYFGRYIPHSPSNAPEVTAAASLESTTFKQFAERYAELFGTAISDIWHDSEHVTPRRRVLNDHVGHLALRDDLGVAELLGPDGHVLLSVNDLARDALAFITRTGAFYVRELPGDLDDDEKVALISALVQFKLLRLAS